MTFRDYIITIHSHCCCKSQHETIIKLFQAADAQNEVVPETAKSWLKNGKGHRNCNIKDYFPKDSLNETGFINFFESRIKSDWKKLQTEFLSINNDNIIDLHTDIAKDFYWSLLNQFQKIHNMPLSKMPIELKDTSVCNEIVNIFKEAAEFYHITDFITRNPALLDFKLPNMNYDLQKLVTRFIEEIEYNIITLFTPYKDEMVYIKISRFIFLIKEYLSLISTSNNIFSHSDKIANTFLSYNLNSMIHSEFEAQKSETDTERLQAQLKSIYNEICHLYTPTNSVEEI